MIVIIRWKHSLNSKKLIYIENSWESHVVKTNDWILAKWIWKTRFNSHRFSFNYYGLFFWSYCCWFSFIFLFFDIHSHQINHFINNIEAICCIDLFSILAFIAPINRHVSMYDSKHFNYDCKISFECLRTVLFSVPIKNENKLFCWHCGGIRTMMAFKINATYLISSKRLTLLRRWYACTFS